MFSVNVFPKTHIDQISSVLLLTHCSHWMSVALSKQILSDDMRKNHQALLSQWLSVQIGDHVLFLCTAGSQAVVNSCFGARDENNITSHPSGAWHRTRSPPWVSLFNIRVLYSGAARRSEIYGRFSIRSVSHTRKHKHRDTSAQDLQTIVLLQR